METFFIKALQLIVALVLLVTIHEFGHYIFARIFGIRVNRFYLFFNPWFSLLKYYPSKGKLEIIGWTTKKEDPNNNAKTIEEPHALLTLNVGKPRPTEKNGKPTWAATLFGLGWVPLGGYCDIAGMVDETKSANDLESEPQEWEFRSKSAWKRFMVMVAGVLFNFLLAIAIYAGIAFHWGERSVPFNEAYEGMDFAAPMHDAGFQDGDILLAVNGKKAEVSDRSLLMDMIQPNARVQVLRNHADTVTIKVPNSLFESLADQKSALMTYRVPVIVEQLQGGMAAKKAGMLEGDRIVKIAEDTVPSQTELYNVLQNHKNQEVTVKVLRNDKPVELTMEVNGDGKIGIMMRPLDKIYPVEEVKYGFFESVPRGWEIGTSTLSTYVSSLKLLFTKSGVQQVGGFGTLGSLFPEKWNWYSFWQITAFLSVILAFMNIIPIPGLDGGHVLFLLWEMVTGRKASDKFLEVANTIGFAFLLVLLLYANGADLLRAFR